MKRGKSKWKHRSECRDGGGRVGGGGGGGDGEGVGVREIEPSSQLEVPGVFAEVPGDDASVEAARGELAVVVLVDGDGHDVVVVAGDGWW